VGSRRFEDLVIEDVHDLSILVAIGDVARVPKVARTSAP
jgi:hypothetical protein